MSIVGIDQASSATAFLAAPTRLLQVEAGRNALATVEKASNEVKATARMDRWRVLMGKVMVLENSKVCGL